MAGTNTIIIPNPFGLPIVIPGDNTLNWNDKLWNWLRYGSNYPTPPSPTISAPQTSGQMTTTGAWTPDIAASQSASDYSQALQDFYGTLDTTINAPSGSNNWVLWAIGGIVLLLLIRR